MEHKRRPHDEGVPAPRLPWWMSRRIRLTALLLVLAVTALALTGARRSLFSGATASARTMCIRPMLPRVMDVPLDRVLELRAQLLPVVGRRRRTPHPGRNGHSREHQAGAPTADAGHVPSAGDLWPGGYEMRQQAGDGDYLAADALLFATAREAHSYVELTTRAACRFPPIEVKATSAPAANAQSRVGRFRSLHHLHRPRRSRSARLPHRRGARAEPRDTPLHLPARPRRRQGQCPGLQTGRRALLDGRSVARRMIAQPVARPRTQARCPIVGVGEPASVE